MFNDNYINVNYVGIVKFNTYEKFKNNTIAKLNAQTMLIFVNCDTNQLRN